MPPTPPLTLRPCRTARLSAGRWPQASHTAAAAALPRDCFATVDDFLGPAAATTLRKEVLGMYDDGKLSPGLLEGGRATKIRGDHVGWVDEDAAARYPGARIPAASRLGQACPQLTARGVQGSASI